MSLINSKLCKLELNHAIFFSIISGNTIYLKGRKKSSTIPDLD